RVTHGANPSGDDGGRHAESESCVVVGSELATVATKRRQRACGPQSGSRKVTCGGAEPSRDVEGDMWCALPRAMASNAPVHRDRGLWHVRKGRPGTWDGVSTLCREIGTTRRGKPSRSGV